MSELPKLSKRIAAPSHHLSESEQVLTVTGTPRTQSSNTTVQGSSVPNSYLMGASGSGGGIGIRIRIEEGKNFLKWRKREEISCFEVLDILFEEL
jgi:hypothetical protein